VRDGSFVLRTGVALAVAASASLSTTVAVAQSRPDPMLNALPAWDANHDGIYTCDEWKSFMDRIFVSADKGRKGFLTPPEFNSIKKADPVLTEAEFAYFDENRDGKISRKEFVEKPNLFIMRFDRNGDCRVTPDELKAAQTGGAPKAGR